MVSIGHRGLFGFPGVRVEILGSLRCKFLDVGGDDGRILLGFFDTVVDTMGEGVDWDCDRWGLGWSGFCS